MLSSAAQVGTESFCNNALERLAGFSHCEYLHVPLDLQNFPMQ
jgi:hypothetical protein